MTAHIARHARSLWLAMLLLTIGGIAGALSLPVSLFPQIDYFLIGIGAYEPRFIMEANHNSPVEA